MKKLPIDQPQKGMTQYADINAFLQRAEQLDKTKLIQFCHKECYRAITVLQHAPDQQGYRAYSDFVQIATQYFKAGTRPRSLSTADFQRLKPITAALVKRGEWDGDTLETFRQER